MHSLALHYAPYELSVERQRLLLFDRQNAATVASSGNLVGWLIKRDKCVASENRQNRSYQMQVKTTINFNKKVKSIRGSESTELLQQMKTNEELKRRRTAKPHGSHAPASQPQSATGSL